MKKLIIHAIILLLLGIIGYIINKHIVTITDYSSNATPKTIFVFDLSTVKKIPNYEKDEGYELVLESDYDKYHQGYCLKENRILSDEEIFRRGIKDYLEKDMQLEEKISIYYFNCCSPKEKIEPVKYYQISGINAANWYEKFTENHFWMTESGLKEMIFKTFKAKPVDNVIDYVKIDMKTMTASFKEPIALSSRNGDYEIYIEKSFLLYKSSDEYGIRSYDIYLIRKKEIWIGEKERHKKFQKQVGKRDGFDRWYHKNIDHCGNIDFNVEKAFLRSINGEF